MEPNTYSETPEDWMIAIQGGLGMSKVQIQGANRDGYFPMINFEYGYKRLIRKVTDPNL